MSEVTDLLRQLVAIDSINPSLVPGGTGEGEIARFVAGWLEDAGLEVQIDEVLPGRPNVIGVARGLGGGHSLLLNAHMDTVGVDGMERPHEPYIVDNRLYGRGAFDMKSGLAAIMLAAKEAQKLQLHGDVIVTAVMDEEYASAGTQSIVKRWQADAAIVTEPTGLDICIAHKGFAWFEIETTGVAAHGSLPDVGVDAIVKMGKILVGLEELERSLRTKPSHPLLGSGSVHASLIEGGQELSSYPQRCVLSLERRTVPGELNIEAEMQELIDQAGRSDPHFKAALRAGLVRQPFEVSEDEAIVRIVCGQAEKILGHEVGIAGATGWMDSALLSAAGIPTVVFGPGGEGAHAVEEWADLEQLQRCTEILLATIQHFCA
ncbi:MAG TPA: ArgE/DapE family deacylase [Ktedonobacteraceae bacterium]|nr:ArgE/DapE family deacylase [Ktedonobacteraceae bacterium]